MPKIRPRLGPSLMPSLRPNLRPNQVQVQALLSGVVDINLSAKLLFQPVLEESGLVPTKMVSIL